MKHVLAGALATSAALGPARADHADVMGFMFDGALSMSLAEFDACVFDADRVRPHDEMTDACRSALETCHSRMHIEPGALPRDVGGRMLLERCLREDEGRFHVLLQHHAIGVLADLPEDADAEARADLLETHLRKPQAAAHDAYAACLAEASGPGEVARRLCARDWRYDQLLRARQTVRGAAP